MNFMIAPYLPTYMRLLRVGGLGNKLNHVARVNSSLQPHHRRTILSSDPDRIYNFYSYLKCDTSDPLINVRLWQMARDTAMRIVRDILFTFSDFPRIIVVFKWRKDVPVVVYHPSIRITLTCTSIIVTNYWKTKHLLQYCGQLNRSPSIAHPFRARHNRRWRVNLTSA